MKQDVRKDVRVERRRMAIEAANRIMQEFGVGNTIPFPRFDQICAEIGLISPYEIDKFGHIEREKAIYNRYRARRAISRYGMYGNKPFELKVGYDDYHYQVCEVLDPQSPRRDGFLPEPYYEDDIYGEAIELTISRPLPHFMLMRLERLLEEFHDCQRNLEEAHTKMSVALKVLARHIDDINRGIDIA